MEETKVLWRAGVNDMNVDRGTLAQMNACLGGEMGAAPIAFGGSFRNLWKLSPFSHYASCQCRVSICMVQISKFMLSDVSVRETNLGIRQVTWHFDGIAVKMPKCLFLNYREEGHIGILPICIEHLCRPVYCHCHLQTTACKFTWPNE
jgi:hypothetical protein